jgi:hypothetical protein
VGGAENAPLCGAGDPSGVKPPLRRGLLVSMLDDATPVAVLALSFPIARSGTPVDCLSPPALPFCAIEATQRPRVRSLVHNGAHVHKKSYVCVSNRAVVIIP